MANSRQMLREDKPSNSSRGKGLILETPYHPGFVDDKDLETVKMAVDKELSEISNAFYQTTEKTADTITRVDKLEIGSGEGFDKLNAKIEEVDRVSKENDTALAERITTVQAESSAGLAKVTNEITAVSDKLGNVEAKWGLQVEAGDVVGSIELGATAGGESTFKVRADRFVVSDGTNTTTPPFEVVGGNTRVKSLFVNTLQSDNWNGTDTGWAITKDGYINMQNAIVRGNIQADTGYFSGELRAAKGTFAGDITAATGIFSGGLSIQDQGGNVGLKITNNQIVVYDEYGRVRVVVGRIG